MWECIVGRNLVPARHCEFPQWEIHHGTQGSRYELRNIEKGTRAPLFKDNPNASIFTVLDVADEAIRSNEFLKKIEEGTL